MNNQDIEKIIEKDIERVYLGNLSTVEVDITLPKEGENGTLFTWHSSKKHLLSDSGKVVRPHFGAGNRKVILTLTATLNGTTKTKKFEANILEKEYPSKVISAYPITIYTEIEKIPELPAVVVIHNNLGEDAVVPVKWDSVDKNLVQDENEFTIEGKVKDGVTVSAKVFVTNDGELLKPKLNIKKNISTFNGKDINLLPESDFYYNQQNFLNALLNMDDDSMLYNFRQAAGLGTKGAQPMTGWDAPEGKLRGHTTGHYLSGLALSYSATQNKKIKEKLDYLIDELYICQKEMENQPDKFKSGFLSGYDESQFDLLEEYTTYPTIWAPYYTLHKIMAGLKDCYYEAGSDKALEILKKLGLWVYNRLSKLTNTQRNKMWSMYIAGEFGGINETLADLYIITKDKRYLTASTYFDNDKLYLPMRMKIDALGNLHANQHIPQIIGCLRQFDASYEKERYEIAETFWNFVTNEHIYSIGGTGETEMFKPPRQIAKFISEKTAESCASYNMLKLTGKLFEYEDDIKYMDYYEKTVTNHILSCGETSAPTGGTTYFMGLSPGSKKEFGTIENTCCHGTGLENHFKYGEYIFTESSDELIVNLFIPSKLKNNKKDIILTTGVSKNSIDVKIENNKNDKKYIKIRKPYWAKNTSIKTNEKKSDIVEDMGYFKFKGDIKKIEIQFICRGHLNRCIDDYKTASIFWGPYTLAVVSDNKEYFNLKLDDHNISDKLIHDGDLNFKLENLKLRPLSRIEKEKYHIYIKIN